MKKISAFWLLVPIFLYSCCSPRGNESLPLLTPNFRGYVGSAPEFFLLNCFYKNNILGEIFGNPDSVIVLNNMLIIGEGNRVSLVCPGLNTMDADFYVKVPYGDGVRFYFRASGKDFEISPKLIFEFTKQGSKVFENRRLLASVDSVRLSNEKGSRIFIQNEGEVFHIIVGIDTVLQGRTKIPLSEYIYVEPINGKVVIEDVYFYDLLPSSGLN